MRREGIWYREELVVVRDLLHMEVARGGHDQMQMIALGSLLMKVEREMASAPSMLTPEAVA
jgi:hypothetical protein